MCPAEWRVVCRGWGLPREARRRKVGRVDIEVCEGEGGVCRVKDDRVGVRVGVAFVVTSWKF